MTQKEITEYAKTVRDDVEKGEYKADDYVIIISSYKGFEYEKINKRIKRVYKNVDEFETNSLAHLNEIDSMFGIDIEVHTFN